MSRNRKRQEPEDAFRSSFFSLMSGIETITVCEVVQYNSENHTANVQPVVMRVYDSDLDNPRPRAEMLNLPINDVVAGEYVISGELTAGQAVIVAHASRSIERWKSEGGVADSGLARMFSYSDGVIIGALTPAGLSDQVPNRPAGVSIRKRDGTTSLTINDEGIAAQIGAQSFTMDGSSFTFSGGPIMCEDITSSGSITGLTVATQAGVDLGAHMHPYVDSRGSAATPTPSVSSPPTPTPPTP